MDILKEEYTLLNTEQLAERLNYDHRTIRERVVKLHFKEGVHYIRPFAGRRMLYLWENIRRDFIYKEINSGARRKNYILDVMEETSWLPMMMLRISYDSGNTLRLFFTNYSHHEIGDVKKALSGLMEQIFNVENYSLLHPKLKESGVVNARIVSVENLGDLPEEVLESIWIHDDMENVMTRASYGGRPGSEKERSQPKETQKHQASQSDEKNDLEHTARYFDEKTWAKIKGTGKLKKIVVEGREFENISSAAKHYGVTSQAMHLRMKKIFRLTKPKVGKTLVITRNPLISEVNSNFIAAGQGRKKINLQVKGKEFETIRAAAKHFGVNEKTASRKMRMAGENPSQETIDRIFTPTGRHTRNPKSITVKGIDFRSVTAAARHFGIRQSVVDSRIRKLGKNPAQNQIDACFDK